MVLYTQNFDDIDIHLAHMLGRIITHASCDTNFAFCLVVFGYNVIANIAFENIYHALIFTKIIIL